MNDGVVIRFLQAETVGSEVTCTREGGLVAFITSQGVLDAALNEPIRRYLMQNYRLISAIRLPSGMLGE